MAASWASRWIYNPTGPQVVNHIFTINLLLTFKNSNPGSISKILNNFNQIKYFIGIRVYNLGLRNSGATKIFNLPS
jgi:hypothetical protein